MTISRHTDAGALFRLNSSRVAEHPDDSWSHGGRWFFSALLDPHRKFVDVLVVLPEHEAVSVKRCRLQSLTTLHTSSTELEVLRLLDWDTTDCYRIRCSLSEHDVNLFKGQDMRVTLSFDLSTPTDLPWQQVEPVLPDSGHLAACVGPVFSSRPYLDIHDYVEYYSGLGIEHFYVYIQINADAPLEPDLTMPNVTWVEYAVSSKQRYAGQVLMMQDCHSRLRYAYDYVAYFDVDEYLVMNINMTLLPYLFSTMPVEQTGLDQISQVTFSSWDFPAHCHKSSGTVSLIDPDGLGKAKLPVWEMLQFGKAACTGFGANFKSIVRPHAVEHRNPHNVSSFTSRHHHHIEVPCSDAFFKHFRMPVGFAVDCSELTMIH